MRTLVVFCIHQLVDAPRSSQGLDRNMKFLAFLGNEGIGQTLNITLTFGQFTELCTVVQYDDDEERLNRDLTKSRQSGVQDYLTGRDDTVLPQVCLVCTHWDIKPIPGYVNLVEVTIPAGAERALVDGQARRIGVEGSLSIKPELANRTIDMKALCTHSDTLKEKAGFIRQVFSDYHKKVVKPNSSINLFFDSSEQSSTFVVDTLRCLEKEGNPLASQVSKDGQSKKIYTLAQFKSFIREFTGKSDREINEEFKEANVRELWMNMISSYLSVVTQTFNVFEQVESLSQVNEAKKENVLCTAIGIEALGRLGNLLIENAVRDNKRPEFLEVTKLSEIELGRDADTWVDSVVSKDGKMIKGSAREMAIKLALTAQIMPTQKFLGMSSGK